jgi:hypothetical protein
MHAILLGSHVLLGSLAVIAGAIALMIRKGTPAHIRAGRLFVVTMGLSSAIGAALGLMNTQEYYITFHAGLLGVILISTSWLAAWAQPFTFGTTSLALAVLNLINTASLVAIGFYATSLPGSVFLAFHASDYFFLGGMSALVLIGDISFLWRKKLSDKHRIARHLWRMCFGFFIAAGSAFTGPGAAIFPEVIRNSGLLSLPELLILLTMLFWLARTLLQRSAQ